MYVHAIFSQPLIWTNLPITFDNTDVTNFTNADVAVGWYYNYTIFSAENLDPGVHNVLVMQQVPQDGSQGYNWIFFDYLEYS